MKCHRILGIEESASESAISQAYQEKMDNLFSNESDYSERIKEKKAEELLAAKNNCIGWLHSTRSEKVSLRIREKGESLANPNIMYSSDIGCCSGCAGVCANDKCCGACCGDDCVSCATAVDIGAYAMIGLWVIGGIISFANKISKKIQEDVERDRKARHDAAITDNQRLQKELNQANSQLTAAKDNLAAVTYEYNKVSAFCKFFEKLECTDCTSIINAQQGPVTAARTRFNKAQENVRSIQAQIHRNDSIIHQSL